MIQILLKNHHFYRIIKLVLLPLAYLFQLPIEELLFRVFYYTLTPLSPFFLKTLWSDSSHKTDSLFPKIFQIVFFFVPSCASTYFSALLRLLSYSSVPDSR